MSHLWSPKLSTHVEVSDCFFENGGAKDVPVLGVDGAAVSGIGAFWRVERCQVINCYRGFEIENSGRNVIEQVRITDNTLTGIADLGVMLFATNGDGSLFRDISITGNKCYDTQPTRTQAYGIYLGPGVSGAMIRDNYCPDSLHTRAGIRDLGVATDLGGNKTTTQGLFDGGVLTSAVLINTPLAASIGVRPDGLVTLNWQPISSLTYRVEYKDSLVAPAWTQLTNYQATVGNAATVFDNMGANRKRYYRIREIEPPFRPLGGPEEPLSGL